SKGRIDKVTDEQILNCYHLLAEKEGVFVEPSSAAGVAGLLMLKEKNELPKDKVIVITVTGNGLKDSHWALEGAKDPIKVSVDAKSAAKALGF
ncbi:MAG: pyridoxal-phosphate dependent enzyme, partial [Actinomycetes bacterium]